MTIVNTYEAKTKLSELLRRVAKGEDIVIAAAGVPVARLVPVQSAHKPSRLGIDEGAFVVPDDFNETLLDEY
jgi:prevent-host-death family protein